MYNELSYAYRSVLKDQNAHPSDMKSSSSDSLEHYLKRPLHHGMDRNNIFV